MCLWLLKPILQLRLRRINDAGQCVCRQARGLVVVPAERSSRQDGLARGTNGTDTHDMVESSYLKLSSQCAG